MPVGFREKSRHACWRGGLLALAGCLTSLAGCALPRDGQNVESPKSPQSAKTSSVAPLVWFEPPQTDPPERESGLVQASFQQQKGDSPPDQEKKPDVLPLPKSVETPDSRKDKSQEANSSKGLSFDQVINTTLTADPKIRAGLEIINQANADLLTSSLLPNPSYFGDVQLLPLTRPFTPTDQGGPPQTDHMVGFSIDWFLFGKRAAAMASTAAGVRISESDYADLIRQRVRDASAAFYDVLEAEALLELAKQDLANLRRVENATRNAVGVGGRPIVDLNRARLDVLKSEQSKREAESNVAITMAKLRAFLGRRDADPNFAIRGTLESPLKVQPDPVEEALNLADQNRPDILSARRQIEKATRDVAWEQKKAYPTVTPQLGYTKQFQQNTIGFPDASSWLTSVSVSLPLFDRNQGNIAKARSVLSQNIYNLEANLVDLRAEVVQVVQDFQTAYKTAQAVSETQLKVATEVRDAIEKAYAAGGRTLLDALDAQRNYRETYRLYINSRANYWRAAYRYSAAIGKQVVQP